MPDNACIVRHNLLDARFYDALLADSALLGTLNTAIWQTAPDCQALLQDLYYLLYKKVLVIEAPVPATLHGLILEELSQHSSLQKLRSRTAGNRAETHVALWVLTRDLLERLRGAAWTKECSELLQTLADRPAPFEESTGVGPQPDAPDFAQDFWKGLLTQRGSEALTGITSSLKGDAGLAEQIETLEELAEQLSALSNPADRRPGPLSSTALAQALAASDNSTAPPDDFLTAVLDDMGPAQENRPEPARFENTSEPIPRIGADESSAIPEQHAGHADKTGKALKAAAETGRQRLSGITPGTWRGLNESLTVPSQTGADTRRVLADGKADTARTPIAAGFEADQTQQTAGERTALKAPAGHPALSRKASTSAGSQEIAVKKARRHLEQLRASALLDHAADQLDRLNSQLSHAGTTLQDMDGLPYDDLISHYKRTLDPLMIRFFNKVGQKREIARMAQHKKKARRDLQVDKVRMDDDLDSLLDEELTDLAMGIEAFENSFIDRFLHKNLLTLERVTRTARHKGPIILCYDGSGSMEGDKIWETKAHILAFTEVARRQKRRMITIQFASASEPLFVREIHPRRIQFTEILELMDTFLRGGTDFEHPLKAAMKYLETDRFRNGDILFITDGICSISEAFKQRFLASKADKKFKLYAVIIHGNTYRDYGDLSDIADEVLEIRQRDLSEWNEKVSERIFSI